MDKVVLYVILGVLVTLVIALLYKLQYLKSKVHEKQKNDELDYSNKIMSIKAKYENDINELKDIHRKELRNEFEKGFIRGETISKIDVQILPFKRSIKAGNYFSKSETLECGYKYQLFSNGLPCLEPKEVIVDSISIKELNNERIDLLMDKFNEIVEKIPNSNLLLGETLSSFGKGLRSLVKK